MKGLEEFIESSKKELYRYSQLNHQQHGHLWGMLLGLGLGIYVAVNYDSSKPSWTIDGTLDHDSTLFNQILRGCVVPLSSGLFANLFSNMGAGVDVITNKNTLVSVITNYFSKCSSVVNNKNGIFYHSESPTQSESVNSEAPAPALEEQKQFF